MIFLTLISPKSADCSVHASSIAEMINDDNVVLFCLSQKMSDGSKCRGYGAGLQNAVLGENEFTVDCTHAGKLYLLNPN